MAIIYSTVGLVIFVAMCTAAYKYFRHRESKFYRKAFWNCAAILVAMLVADTYFGIIPHKKSTAETILLSSDECAVLVAAMRDTERELKALDIVNEVNFSEHDNIFEIEVSVKESTTAKNIEDLREETYKIFWYGIIDNLTVAELPGKGGV